MEDEYGIDMQETNDLIEKIGILVESLSDEIGELKREIKNKEKEKRKESHIPWYMIILMSIFLGLAIQVAYNNRIDSVKSKDFSHKVYQDMLSVWPEIPMEIKKKLHYDYNGGGNHYADEK